MIPRDLLRTCFRTALAAVEPAAAVRAAVRRDGEWLHCGSWRHRLAGRVIVIGAGKASAPMALAIEELVADRVAGGCIVVKYGHTVPLKHLRLYEAGHPIPDAAGEIGAQAIESAVRGLNPQDLVIFCLSGGASSLLAAPRPPVTLVDKQVITALLLASGADIHAVNTVRKHLSRLKGGGLARACAPATVLTLAISDVPDDDLGIIGSGPTTPDYSTPADALAIVNKCLPGAQIPPAVITALSRTDITTPHDFSHVHQRIIASNRIALNAVERSCLQEKVEIGNPLTGQAHLAAEQFCRRAAALPPGSLLVAGGETTVMLGEQPGRGGRNQEFALAAARWIMAHDAPLTVLAVCTDGNDGPTDAAGGLVDGTSWERALAAGLDPHRALAGHDAYPLLQALGDLVITGPTNTNVMDLALAYRT